MVIVAEHITVNPEQRESYLAGSMSIRKSSPGRWLPRLRDHGRPARPRTAIASTGLRSPDTARSDKLSG
jgi:hypothetical protein